MSFDIVIRGGTVLDGRGGEPRLADVGVAGERIAAIERSLDGMEAGRTLDAAGLAVAPGFIDIHAHGDVVPLAAPEAPARLHDGVTTELLGNCGGSPFPQSRAMLAARAESLERHGVAVDWATLDDYAARHDALGCGINRGSLVGHGTVRIAVMGEQDRPPTDGELAAMSRHVEEAIEAGAFGISTGLIYAPGMYAQPQEIEALCAVAARLDGLYASHIRSESGAVLEALDEFLDVGRRTGVRLQHSHAKVSGRAHWDKVDAAIARLEAARAEGIDVACDRYPYTASWTSLTAFLPGWAREGGREEMLGRLAEPDACGRILEWLRGRERGAPWTALVVASAGCDAWRHAEGRSLADVSAETGMEPATLAVELLIVFVYCRRKKTPLARPLRVGIWANLLTWPVVWFLVIGIPITLATADEIVLFIMIEAMAASFEGIMYAWRGKMGWNSGILVALIANTASALLGLVL